MGADNQAQIELSRRQFLQVSSLAAIEAISNGNWTPKAVLGILSKLQAQAEGYLIQDLPFTPTFGEQSLPWAPAREDNRERYNSHDQLEQIVFGSSAYSVYRGSTGDLIQNGLQDEAKSASNGLVWVGSCRPASVGAWWLPWITEDRPVLDGSFIIPKRDQYYLGLTLSANGLIEREWGRLSRVEYTEIQAIHAGLKADGDPRALVVDTSDYRNASGQQWFGLIYSFDGRWMNLTNFKEREELDQGDPRKPYNIPFDQVTRVQLINPTQPRPGRESNYWYTLNRDIAKVCLGMAELIQV